MGYGKLSGTPEQHIELVGFIGTWYMYKGAYEQIPDVGELFFVSEQTQRDPVLVVTPTAMIEGTFAPPDVEEADPPSWYFEGTLSQPSKTETVGSKVFGILFPPHFAIVGVCADE